MPEPRRDKTSAEIKKEKLAQRLAEGRRTANELNGIYNNLRNKFNVVEKSGAIPDEGVLRGYRKKLQYLSGGLTRLKRIGVDCAFNQGQINFLTRKLNKWMSGEGLAAAAQRSDTGARTGTEAEQRTSQTATRRGPGLDELLQNIGRGTGAVYDPAVQEVITLLKDIAKKKLMNEQTLMVARRARKLMNEQKRSEIEIENYLKDKLVEPVLNEIFAAFISRLRSANIKLSKDTMNYIETCVKGGRSRREFINLLLERRTGFHYID